MADLNRETFVLTGKTGNLSRQDVRQRIQNNNGYVRDALPEPGDIVVVRNLHTAPPRTQKFADAQNKGCRMISDQQLVQIFNGGLTLAAALAGQNAPTPPAPAAAAPKAAKSAPAAPKPDVMSLIKPSTGTYTVGF